MHSLQLQIVLLATVKGYVICYAYLDKHDQGNTEDPEYVVHVSYSLWVCGRSLLYL